MAQRLVPLHLDEGYSSRNQQSWIVMRVARGNTATDVCHMSHPVLAGPQAASSLAAPSEPQVSAASSSASKAYQNRTTSRAAPVTRLAVGGG